MTQSNKEVLARKREKVKEWKLNNREKVLAQKKRHYDKYKHREKNREAMLAREKEYREKNKEKIAKRARENTTRKIKINEGHRKQEISTLETRIFPCGQSQLFRKGSKRSNLTFFWLGGISSIPHLQNRF